MGTIENVGTFILTGEALPILQQYGVRNISFLLISGTVTITGTMSLGATMSNPITLQADIPLNISFDFAIDGLIIDATGGSVTIVTGK